MAKLFIATLFALLGVSIFTTIGSPVSNIAPQQTDNSTAVTSTAIDQNAILQALSSILQSLLGGSSNVVQLQTNAQGSMSVFFVDFDNDTDSSGDELAEREFEERERAYERERDDRNFELERAKLELERTKLELQRADRQSKSKPSQGLLNTV